MRTDGFGTCDEKVPPLSARSLVLRRSASDSVMNFLDIIPWGTWSSAEVELPGTFRPLLLFRSENLAGAPRSNRDVSGALSFGS